MPLSLRSHYVCFYCGQKSSRRRNKAVRQWNCESCEAVNYLDEHGEITEPPIEVTSQENRGSSQSSSQYGTSSNTEFSESPFCARCLKNQHIVAQSLASYLPAIEHPKYSEYEASFPQYKRNLEAQYPQVCAECKPRVNQRLRAAEYHAKTDYLRRMIDRTRTLPQRRGSSWKGVLMWLGGAVWTMATLGQILWHGFNSLPTSDEDILDTGESLRNSRVCLLNAVKSYQNTSQCRHIIEPLGDVTILLSLLSVWWNNKLAQRVRGRPGQLRGLRQYYTFQVMVVGVRIAAWQIISDSLHLELTETARRGIHGFTCVFILLTMISSLRMVQLDNKQVFSFRKEELASPAPQRFREPVESLPSRLQESPKKKSPTTSPFPVQNLASPRPRVMMPQTSPPTPPPEQQEDPDAMDWTPTRPTFSVPSQSYPHSQGQFQTSQSFASVDRLPLKRQTFNEVQARQELRRHKTETDRQVSTVQQPLGTWPSGTALDARRNGMRRKKNSDHSQVAELASPRFFPASIANGDTGLESLLQGTNLGTEEEQARNAHLDPLQQRSSRSASPKGIFRTVFNALLIATALVAWIRAPWEAAYAKTVQMSSVGIASIVSSLGFIDAFSEVRQWRGWINAIFASITFVASLGLGLLLERDDGSAIIRDMLAKSLLGCLLLRELGDLAISVSKNFIALSRTDVPSFDENITSSPEPRRLLTRGVSNEKRREKQRRPPSTQLVQSGLGDLGLGAL